MGEIILSTICLVLGICIGLSASHHDLLEECQKKHNVYECEIIAVPKKPAADDGKGKG